MRNLKKLVGNEWYIHSGGRPGIHVEAIGTCSLKLSSGFVLQLEKTFYEPSFSRNLFSISELVPLGISCNFKDTGFMLLINQRLLDMVFCVIVFILYSCKIIMLITH